MKNPSNENKRPRLLDPLPITLHVVEKLESKIKSFWQSLNSAIEEKGFPGFISYPKQLSSNVFPFTFFSKEKKCKNPKNRFIFQRQWKQYVFCKRLLSSLSFNTIIQKKGGLLGCRGTSFCKIGANNPITLSVVPSAKKSEQKLSIAHKIK